MVWLLERAPFGVALCEGDGKVRLNAEAARIAGLTEREVELERWNQRLRLMDGTGAHPIEGERRPLMRALAGRRTPRCRMQVARPDGSRIEVTVEGFALPLGGGRYAGLAMVEDISVSLESEREQAKWLGALGHEVNGVLQLLLTSTQASQLHLTQEPARALHHLQAAQQQVQLMRRLVRDFMEAAQLGAGVFQCHDEPVLVSSLVREIAESAELADPRHRILVEIEDELWVRGDMDRLRQILTNLLSNAAKYANPGLLRVGARRQVDRVVIHVQDEGPGIPVEDQRTLFRRFRRLPSRIEGSGLGLWISRELTQRMGGELWLQSAAGEPTTFFVALPYDPPSRSAVERPGERA